MKTNFSETQMNNPAIQIANDILRNCVHCGFCLATCPTYVILGNELDSPRGRIYQIRDMLEQGPAAAGKKDKKIVKHIDRCLSCLSCMTTCPSGVDYM
ncbi:MAG: 4Fe-4S dicluster domain-containing protein, partial [Rhodospirillaceae bacterium]|nr:4Fe-4S dicluster domain-containing protein [Rhodospirillaceae bacterium]